MRILVGLLMTIAVVAAAQNQPLAFELASVKATKGARCPDQITPNGVIFCDMNLRFLIAEAYHVSITRVVVAAYATN